MQEVHTVFGLVRHSIILSNFSGTRMENLYTLVSPPCYDANAIYQHLEKFDREKKKKSESVRQDSNPLYYASHT